MSCGAVYDQTTVGPVLASIRAAYRSLTKLAEAGTWPRVTFRVKPGRAESTDPQAGRGPKQ
jgi:hypothetical protein